MYTIPLSPSRRYASKSRNVRNQNKTLLNIYYQNCRGLRTKSTEFYCSVLSGNFDIVAVSETWLTSNHYNSEYFDNRYTVIRRDRNLIKTGQTLGGGVLLAVKRDYKILEIDCSELQSDCILAKITGDKINLYICVVYFTPNSSVELYEEVFQFVESKCQVDCTLLVIGDFNLPDICGTDFRFLSASIKYQCLNNFLSFMELQSHNNIRNRFGKTLDLVLSNKNEIEVERNELPLVKEDDYHPALTLNISLTGKLTHNNKESTSLGYNYRKADYYLLYSELSRTNWKELNEYNNVDEMVDTFYNIIYEVFNKCIPKKKAQTRIYPCWMKWDTIKKIRSKHNHHKKIRQGIGNSNYHRQEFNRLRKEIKTETKTAYLRFIENNETALKSNPRLLWDYVKSKTHHLPENTFLYHGRELTNNNDIVDSFAQYFQSVFSKGNSNINFDGGKSEQDSDILLDMLDISHIEKHEIQHAINILKSKTSSGPDDIPTFIVKGCGDFFLAPLKLIFNTILLTSTFPSIWKTASVCPIPKSEKKRDITNYRPISILCTFAKIFETIIYQHIMKHVKPQISVYQHGFLNGRSTVTNLTVLTDFIARTVDTGGQVDVIYTDFAKAFDTVNHNILIRKLTQFNFSPRFIRLFRSYLSNRRQFVKYKGNLSNEYIATSGVPQGSNLGPLLFLLFINDLSSSVKSSSHLLFADDLKLYRQIKTNTDCEILQRDLDNVTEWCKLNALHINVQKCMKMVFTRCKKEIIFPYNISGTILPSPSIVKDLGIFYDSKLTFEPHVNQVINNAYKTLGFIMRIGREFRDSRTIESIFNIFVRPKLEYASVVWNSITKSSQAKLEKIQSKLVRFLAYKQTGIYPAQENYRNLCINFQIMSLEQRRSLNDMMFLYNILNNEIDCIELVSKFSLRVPSTKTRKENNIFFHNTKAKTQLMLKSPTWRMGAVYNDINRKIINCDVFNSKKNVFRRILTNLFSNEEKM